MIHKTALLTTRLAFLLLSVCPACFGQIVRIHVVNIVNGRPLRNQLVDISNFDQRGSTERPDLRLVTDDNGEAQLELPKPTPASFTVKARLSEARWYCECLAVVITQEVTQKGWMSRSPDVSYNKHLLKPTPGEILLLAQATPWWVRILYPLMKD